VRQALTLLFDFEWINRNYFFGLYRRAGGFFAGSNCPAYARSADDREREIAKTLHSRMPPDILDGTYRLPVSDASGRDPYGAGADALALMSQAGYDLDGTVFAPAPRDQDAPHLRNPVTTRDQERIALAFQRDLKRAGIEASSGRRWRAIPISGVWRLIST